MKQIESGFARLDRQKELNKKIFKKCFEDNFPVGKEDKKLIEEQQKTEQPKVIQETVSFKLRQPLIIKCEQKV